MADPRTLKDSFKLVEGWRPTLGVRGFSSLPEFILAVLAVIGTLVAVLALAALIYGAVVYITSLGDEGRTSQAKKIILYAIIGLIVLGAAGIIVNVAINLILK
jgi:hypothetical protein